MHWSVALECRDIGDGPAGYAADSVTMVRYAPSEVTTTEFWRADVSESDDKSHPSGTDKQGEAGQRPLLGLKIPKQATPKPDNILLDPKETESWFDALPMANIGETARRVYNTLVEFNRTEIPDLLRAKTVEKFRPPVEYITDNLQRHYVDVGLPLSRKGWKTAALARELQKELAVSYKVIIERMIGGDAAQFDRRLLVIALHRALHYLGQTLLQNALVYITWPDGIWREINSIYAYASQNHVHQIPVKPDDSKSATTTTTIEDLFKALVLFASATPHRLRQSHARLLFANINEWANHTAILTEDDGGTSLGRFNVDLWADSSPVHNSLRTPMPGRRMAILDVRELLKKMRSDFEEAPWDSRSSIQSGEQIITRPLLRLLIMAWSRPPDRRFVRTKLNFDLRVVAGLHAIHGNLRTDDQQPYATTRTALFTLQEAEDNARTRARSKINWTPGSLENVSLAPLDSGFASDSLLNDSHFVNETMDTESTLTDFADHPTPTDDTHEDSPHEVTTINESAGGYCIRWKGEHIPRVKIGELIGVESPSDRHKYGLGVVRWMHQLPDQSLDLGLEVVSTRCEAGEIREAEADSPRHRSPSFKCLVINDTDQAANATASLVMSAMNLQTELELWLSLSGKEQRIRLTKLIEFSSAFARYQFEFANTGEEERTDENNPGDDFSDLWNNL